MTTNSDSKPKKPDRDKVVKDIESSLKEDKVQFFVNSVLEPTVHFPDDAYQKDWPVDSQRFHDYLNTTYHHLTKQLLTPPLRELLLSLFREECRQGVRRLSENESSRSENNPIVQGILYLMNKQDDLDLLTSDLARQLFDLQKDGRIAQRPDIPTFTNVFSRQLNRLIPVFKGMAIEVTIRHEEDGSHCKMDRLPGFLTEPDDSDDQSSLKASVATRSSATALGIADDTYGPIRMDGPRELPQDNTVETGNSPQADNGDDAEGGVQ